MVGRGPETQGSGQTLLSSSHLKELRKGTDYSSIRDRGLGCTARADTVCIENQPTNYTVEEIIWEPW